MKPGFYISMGIAIAALSVGFILLNDVQQEKETQAIWLQRTPTQCNDVWQVEFDEFFETNPEIKEIPKEKMKEILESIIKNHYEKQGIKILDLNLELDVYEGVRCEACNCLGWDRLSIKIPKSQFELVNKSEGWISLN